MKRFLSLTKVMLKGSLNSLNNLQGFKKKKNDSPLKRFGTYVLMIGLVLYFAALVYFPSKYVIETMVAWGQPSLLIGLLNAFAPILVLFFTIAAIPGIFYFSKDIESYIPLPFKAWEITAAKFFTAYLQTLFTLSVLLIPLYFNYFVIVKPGIMFIFTSLITGIMLPVIPMAISLLVVAVLMRFVPFLKNKSLYVYLSTAFIVLPVFLISFSLSSMQTDGNIAQIIVDSIIAMDDSIYSTISLFFPTSQMFTLAMVDNNIIQLLLGVITSLLIAVGTIFIVQPLYFDAVIGLSESTSKKRNLRLNEMESETKVRAFEKSFILYDLKTILRTPTFAMNYFSAFVILPIMGIIPIFFSDINFAEVFKNMSVVTEQIHAIFYAFSLVDQWELLALIGIGAGILVANFEASSSTAISREGITMKQYLTFPIKFSDIAHAKAKLSMMFSSIYTSIFVMLFVVVVRPRIDTFIVLVLGLIIGIVITTYLSIFVDVLLPSLVWDTEQQAVKGNIIQVLVILPLMFAPGLFILSYFTLNAYINLAIAFILCPLIAYLLIRGTSKAANTRLVEKVQNL